MKKKVLAITMAALVRETFLPEYYLTVVCLIQVTNTL